MPVFPPMRGTSGRVFEYGPWVVDSPQVRNKAEVEEQITPRSNAEIQLSKLLTRTYRSVFLWSCRLPAVRLLTLVAPPLMERTDPRTTRLHPSYQGYHRRWSMTQEVCSDQNYPEGLKVSVWRKRVTLWSWLESNYATALLTMKPSLSPEHEFALIGTHIPVAQDCDTLDTNLYGGESTIRFRAQVGFASDLDPSPDSTGFHPRPSNSLDGTPSVQV